MIKGIDLSRWQGTDPELASAGLGYAFIKATEGLSTDNRLADHATEVGATALFRGFYHFYRDAFDPEEQAIAFWNAIKGYMDVFSLPPVLDLEDTNAQRDPVSYAVRVLAFLKKLGALSGYRPMVYTNKNYIAEKLGNTSLLSVYRLWDAAYEANAATPYGGWQAATFWQYTSQSQVAGEAAPVDGDLFLGTPQQLLSLTHAAVCKGQLSPEDWASQNNIKIY